MINTRFISIFLVTALIVSAFGFTASAQSAPSLGSGSADILTSHNVNLSVFVNPNGSTMSICFKYGTSSNNMTSSRCYYDASGTSEIKVGVGLISLAEGTTYFYQATAQNANGSASGSVLSFTTPGNSPSFNGSNTSSGSNNNGQAINSNYSSNSTGSNGAPLAPSVATNGPASVTASLAVINGSVNPNNVYTNFWFDFGTSPSLGQKTSVQPAGVGNTWQLVTGNLSGLISGATYYYRVAAQNSQGTNWGEIKTFVAVNSGGSSTSTNGQVLGSSSGNSNGSRTTNSLNSTTARTTTTASNPAKDRPSFISLEYSLGNDGALVLVADNIKPKTGEEFSYTVVYKNDTGVSSNEANLKVILPIQVDYIGSDKEPNNISANIVEFNLGNIADQTQGTVVVIVKVKETIESGTNLIFTSVLGYKDSKGTQLANTSYMTVRVSEAGAPLSASFGSFIGASSMLWLIAIVLIMIMGLLVFRLVRMRKNDSVQVREDIFGFGKVPPTFEPIS